MSTSPASTDPRSIQFRAARVNPDTKLYRAVRRCAPPLVHGRVLAIDPSVGSSSSQPGYAIYLAGRLLEYGTIEIPPTDSTHRRLYELGRSLREDFAEQQFDVLVVEDIPHARYEATGIRGIKGRSLETQIPLHRAVGAVLSNVAAEHCVAVTPITWRAFAPKDYVKSDAGDAVCIGHAAIAYAREILADAINRPKKRKGGAAK